MPDVPGSRPAVPPPQGWQQLLRERGYRLTPQRQLVLEAVDRLEHPTPETILERVRETAAAVNLSTVYRTLDLLEELGLVTHAHLSHRSPSYHTTAAGPHVHLVCTSCGRVQETGADVISDVVRRVGDDLGFTVDVGHASLSGLCAACSERGAPVAASTGGPRPGAAGGRTRS